MARVRYYKGSICKPGRPRKKTKFARKMHQRLRPQMPPKTKDVPNSVIATQREAGVSAEINNLSASASDLGVIPPITEGIGNHNNLEITAIKEEPDENTPDNTVTLIVAKQEPVDVTIQAPVNFSQTENPDSTTEPEIKTELPDLPVIAKVSSCVKVKAAERTKRKKRTSKKQLTKKKPRGGIPPPDEWTTFGEFVASKMRDMPDKDTQLFAKQCITDILMQSDMGQLKENIVHWSKLHQEQSSSSITPLTSANINQIPSSPYATPFTSTNQGSSNTQTLTSASFNENQSSSSLLFVPVKQSNISDSSPNSNNHQTASPVSNEKAFDASDFAKSCSSSNKSASKQYSLSATSSSSHQNSADRSVFLTAPSSSMKGSSLSHVLPITFPVSEPNSVNSSVTSANSCSSSQSSSKLCVPPAVTSSSSQVSCNPPIISKTSSTQSPPVPVIFPTVPSKFSQTSTAPYVLRNASVNLNQNPSTPNILPTKTSNINQSSSSPYIETPTLNALPVVTMIVPNMSGMPYVRKFLPHQKRLDDPYSPTYPRV